jgi:hypothetical protein
VSICQNTTISQVAGINLVYLYWQRRKIQNLLGQHAIWLYRSFSVTTSLNILEFLTGNFDALCICLAMQKQKTVKDIVALQQYYHKINEAIWIFWKSHSLPYNITTTKSTTKSEIFCSWTVLYLINEIFTQWNKQPRTVLLTTNQQSHLKTLCFLIISQTPFRLQDFWSIIWTEWSQSSNIISHQIQIQFRSFSPFVLPGMQQIILRG